MIGTSAATQAACRTSTYRLYKPIGRKAECGRFSVLPRPEIYRNLRIKNSVKIETKESVFKQTHSTGAYRKTA